VKKRPPLGDGWFESEEPIGRGTVTELQRIRRRTVVRPIPVILAALLVTGAVTYKVVTKTRLYTSDVVLAVNEGALASTTLRSNGIPFEELKEYVASVLIPDSELEKLLEARSPGRIDKVGRAFAIEQLRGRIVVSIWKNSFVYYTDAESNTAKSARIGIEVTDEDPDHAHEIAHELAEIAIRTHEERQAKVTKQLADDVAEIRDRLDARLEEISKQISTKQEGLIKARKETKNELAALLVVDLAALAHEQKTAQADLAKVAASPDALADQISAAQLDTTISIVDDVRPEPYQQSPMVLAMIIAVILVVSFIGAALVLGAFDTRVHETDDVTRLGLPVLGHVPGFPGDHVGSLEARGAIRARVPSFLRWRSQQ
jgi:capsular polysaccharide biosynthesis protein